MNKQSNKQENQVTWQRRIDLGKYSLTSLWTNLALLNYKWPYHTPFIFPGWKAKWTLSKTMRGWQWRTWHSTCQPSSTTTAYLHMLPAYTPTATVCMQCTSVVITLSSALTWAQTTVWNVHTAVCSSEFEEVVKRLEVLLQCHPPILQRGSVPKDLWYYHRLTSFSFCCLLGNGRCGTQRTQYLWIPNPLLGMWPIP